MSYFPMDSISWIYLFLYLGSIAGIYILILRKREKNESRRSQFRWTFILWALVSIFTNLFLRIPIKRADGFGIDVYVLQTYVYLFGLLPTIYFAYHGRSYLETAIIAALSGFTQSVAGGGNIFLVPVFITTGFLIRDLASYTPAIISEKMNQHPLIGSLWAGVILYPIVTITSFFLIPGNLALRLGTALIAGQLYWFSVFLSLLIGGGIIEGYNLLRKHREPAKRNYGWWHFNVFTKLPILLFIALLSASLIWQYFYQQNSNEAVERLTYTAEGVVENYERFIEIGKSVIQTNHDSDRIIAAIETNQLSEILPVIYHEIPYFQEVAIYDGDVLSDSYPNDAQGIQFVLDPTLEDHLQQMIGTAIPYRVEVVQSDSEKPNYLFFTPIQNSEILLLGLASPQENLFFSSKLESPSYGNEYAWLLQDSLGGKILNTDGLVDFLSVAESILPEHTEGEELRMGNNTSLGQGYYLVKGKGDVKTVFTGVILEDYVALRTYQEMIPILLLELFVIILAYFYSDFHLKSIESDVRKLSQNKAMGNSGRTQAEVLNPSLLELQAAYQNSQKELSDQISQEKGSLKVIQDLSKVNTLDNVLDVILKNEYLSEMGALRLVLNPEISSFLGYGRKTSAFGTGRSLNRYSFLDNELYSKMRSEQLRIISDCKKSSWLGRYNKSDLPGSLIIFSLRSRNVYFGIVWVADQKIRKFDPEDIRFFNIVSNQISISLSNMYAIRVEEANKGRIEFLIQSIPEPVLVLNRHLRLVLINSAARRMTSIFASKISEGMHPDDFVVDPVLHKFLKQTISGKKVVEQLKLSNGCVYSANMVIAAEKTWYQNDWIICTLHDVSTFREKEEISSDFLETVAQYLQTPLHMTNGYLAMLSMVGSLNQAQKEYVSNVKQSVEKMDSFVNDLLDINRLSSGMGLEYRLVFATDLITDVITDLRPLAKQRQVVVISDDIPRRIMSKVELDEKLFYQAIYNLIKNGIENNKMTGEVEIQLHVEGGDLLFVVRDTGVGIAPLDIPEIFDRIQHKTIKIDGQKAGLELPLVKSIVERHHGEIWVESDLGKGSTFYIRIPRVRPKE